MRMESLDCGFWMDCGCVSARNARYYCFKHTPRIKYGGLTNQEIKDGFFIDIVLGKCNIKKAFKDKHEASRKESEEFL